MPDAFHISPFSVNGQGTDEATADLLTSPMASRLAARGTRLMASRLSMEPVLDTDGAVVLIWQRQSDWAFIAAIPAIAVSSVGLCIGAQEQTEDT